MELTLQDTISSKKKLIGLYLPIQIAVYVPSTKNANVPISQEELQERVNEVRKYLAEMFGGFSSESLTGGYVSTFKELIKEDIVRVVAYATKEDFAKNKRKLITQISIWAKEWSQEAIGVEFENDLYYINQAESFYNGGKVEKEGGFLDGYEFSGYEDMIDTLKTAKKDKYDISDYIDEPKDFYNFIKKTIQKAEDIIDEYKYSRDGLVVNVKLNGFDYDIDDAIKIAQKKYNLNDEQVEKLEENFNDDEISNITERVIEMSRSDAEETLKDFIDLDICKDEIFYTGRSGGYLIFQETDFFDSVVESLDDVLYNNFDKNGNFESEDYSSFESFIQREGKEIQKDISFIYYYEFAFGVFEAYVKKAKKYLENIQDTLIEEVEEYTKQYVLDTNDEEVEEGESEYDDGGGVGYEPNPDYEKVVFVNKYSDAFFEYTKKNIKKIVKKLLSDSYYNFKIYDLNVELTIDDLVNANEERTLGEYDDERNELRIVLFKYFEKFLGGVDDLSELSKAEKELIVGGIENILVTANNDFAEKIQSDIRQIFYHEMIHHFDNIKYGKNYSTSVSRLELNKSVIGDEEKRLSYYVNMPHEIDANFISTLARLFHNHGEKYGDFITFKEMFLDYFPRWQELTNDNKNKVIKRLYKYFEHINKNKNNYKEKYETGGGVGNFDINNILSKTNFSESLKQSLAKDFNESGYSNVESLFADTPEKLPVNQKVWATSKNIQDKINGFSSGKNTYLQANKIAEIMYSMVSSPKPKIDVVSDDTKSETINILTKEETFESPKTDVPKKPIDEDEIRRKKSSIFTLLNIYAKSKNDKEREKLWAKIKELKNSLKEMESGNQFEGGGSTQQLTKPNIIKKLNALHKLKDTNESINKKYNNYNTALRVKTGNTYENILNGKTEDRNEYTLAKKYGVSVDVIKKQLQKGIEVEREHIDNPLVRREIALDHIEEMVDYYDRLEKMEKQAKTKHTIRLPKPINKLQVKSLGNYLINKGLSVNDFDISEYGSVVIYKDLNDKTIKEISIYIKNNF